MFSDIDLKKNLWPYVPVTSIYTKQGVQSRDQILRRVIPITDEKFSTWHSIT